MKKFTVLFFLSVFSTQIAAYDLQTIRSRFLQDDISYRQFLDLGKADCLDNVPEPTQTRSARNKRQRENLFANHFNTISALHSMIPYFYHSATVRKAVAHYRQQNIGKLIAEHQEREEYFNIRRSPLLICRKLFSDNAQTKQLYADFIGREDNMIRYPDRSFLETYGAYFDRTDRVYD